MSKKNPTFSDIFKPIENVYKERERQERIRIREENLRIKEENKRILAENEMIVSEKNNHIKSYIEDIENIIINTNFNSFNYESYYKSKMTPLKLNDYISVPFPSEKDLRKKIGCKKERKIIEKIFKKRKIERIEKGNLFEKEWEEAIKEYEQNEKINRQRYNNYKEREIKKNDDENKEIRERMEKFINCDEKEIYDVFKYLYNNYHQPSGGGISSVDFLYNKECKKATISLGFINSDDLLDVKYYIFLKTKNIAKPVFFTITEKENMYEQIVFNSIVSFVATTMLSFSKVIDEVIVNAYVNKINTATGSYEDFYFVSAKLKKEDIPFNSISRIDGKSFLDSKGAKYILPLTKTKKIIPYSFDKENLLNSINEDISGIDFERISKQLLEKNGFEDVNVTKASGDYGADVIAYKDGVKYAIQCKKYSSKVGVNAVQEVIASKSMYKCHVGVVLTNNYFTPNAKKLAEENGVLLWDVEKLQNLISNSGLDGQNKMNKIEYNTDENDNSDIQKYYYAENEKKECETNEVIGEETIEDEERKKLEEKMDDFSLDDWEKEAVRTDGWEPEDFEEEELMEDDYYYDDER